MQTEPSLISHRANNRRRTGHRAARATGAPGDRAGLGRPGGDLLSRALRRSTIGAEGFHGRVRDGIGCFTPRHCHQAVQSRSAGASLRALIRARSKSCALWRTCAKSRCIRRDPVAISLSWSLRLSISRLTGLSVERGLARRAPPPGSVLDGPARDGGKVKPIERLVPVSFTCCHASTPGLSTWWSSTALRRDLVLRGASRLDAFSGYPVRT